MPTPEVATRILERSIFIKLAIIPHLLVGGMSNRYVLGKFKLDAGQYFFIGILLLIVLRGFNECVYQCVGTRHDHQS